MIKIDNYNILFDIRYDETNIIENVILINNLVKELENYYPNCNYKYNKRQLLLLNDSNDFVQISDGGLVVIQNNINSIDNFFEKSIYVIKVFRRIFGINSMRRCGVRTIQTINTESYDKHESIKSRIYNLNSDIIEYTGEIPQSAINLRFRVNSCDVLLSINENNPEKAMMPGIFNITFDTDFYISHGNFETNLSSFFEEAMRFNKENIQGIIERIINKHDHL